MYLQSPVWFNLDSAVRREKAVQHISVLSKSGKFVVTLLVMIHFICFLIALRACADFHDSTGKFRCKCRETRA